MYEYKALHIFTADLTNQTEKLNELAAQGWRVIKTSDDFTTYLLERECEPQQAIVATSPTIAGLVDVVVAQDDTQPIEIVAR